MKKIGIILAAALLVGFASCSKEKNCECITTTTMEGMEPITATATFVTEEECSTGNSEITLEGMATKTVCKEK